MRALVAVILVSATVLYVAASVEDPRTKSELEQFYGAEYPKISERQHEKLARAAIKAQKTGMCNLHHIKWRGSESPCIMDFSSSMTRTNWLTYATFRTCKSTSTVVVFFHHSTLRRNAAGDSCVPPASEHRDSGL
jgi:hypothetical protein